MKKLPFSCLLLALALASLPGCASKPPPPPPPKPEPVKPVVKVEPRAYNIAFTLDPSLLGASVQVDLIGCNSASDLPRWEMYSVSEYWRPRDPLRRDASKAVLAFGPGRPNVQTITMSHARWNEWLRTGALNLVILADLPGISGDRAGAVDPRRLVLPLDRHEWGTEVQQLEVTILASGLQLRTPRAPKPTAQ